MAARLALERRQPRRRAPAADRLGRAGAARQPQFPGLETFSFFAAAVLAVALAHQSDASSLLGAQTYVWARVAYLPIYLAGIPYLRTLVWAASLWGMLQVIEALL